MTIKQKQELIAEVVTLLQIHGVRCEVTRVSKRIMYHFFNRREVLASEASGTSKYYLRTGLGHAFRT